MLVAMVVNFDAARVTLQRERRELRVVKLEQRFGRENQKKKCNRKKKRADICLFFKSTHLKNSKNQNNLFDGIYFTEVISLNDNS